MMADRVSASIVIGGELASDDFITLCRLIVEEDLAIEWDGEPFAPGHRTDGEPLRLFAHEVTGGQFETLESWCIAHALPFVRWCGGYTGAWLPERLVFNGTGDPQSFAANENDNVVADRETVNALGGGRALHAWFDAADFVVPPLIIMADSDAETDAISRARAGQEESGGGDGEQGSQLQKGTAA